MEQSARFIVEGLRSGVPYRELSRKVVFGRERYIEAVKRLLEGVEEGRAPSVPAYIVRAHYGEGKTHLLHSLWGMAEERDWVVTLVSLSKETPLDRLDYFYPKMIRNTYVPGSAQPGAGKIVERALEERMLAEARSIGFSARIMALLDNLIVRNEGYEELLGDIDGEFLSTADIRRIHRQNYARPLPLPRSSLRDEAFEYMRFMDWLVRKAGYRGWLVLVDEVELIGKLGKGARSQAYGNLGRIISGALPNVISVWALAANFYSDVLIKRNDREELPDWLAARPKLAEYAPWCAAGVDALMEAKLLNELTQAQIGELVAQIHALHQEAYGWSAPFDAVDLLAQVRRFSPAQDTRLRTYVRLALTILDIWQQYGEAPTIASLAALTDEPLDEAPQWEAGGE